MSLRDIVLWPDARLSAVCARVEKIRPQIETLAQDMLDTMYAAPGRGLAAPQVGVLKRLFVMDVTWKDGAPNPMIFVNPEVVWESETRVVHSEGCLSIPGVSLEVERPAQITMRWKDLDGAGQEDQFEGFAAVCAQHELDHLNGKVTFDRLEAETRARALKTYSETLA